MPTQRRRTARRRTAAAAAPLARERVARGATARPATGERDERARDDHGRILTAGRGPADHAREEWFTSVTTAIPLSASRTRAVRACESRA